MDKFKLYFGVRNEGHTKRLDVRNEEERISSSSSVLGWSNLGDGVRLGDERVWVSVDS